MSLNLKQYTQIDRINARGLYQKLGKLPVCGIGAWGIMVLQEVY